MFKSDSKAEDIPQNYVEVEQPENAKSPFPALKMTWLESVPSKT